MTSADSNSADGGAAGSDRVRVELVRTGGFGGMELHSVMDTAQLPREEAAELAGLVELVDLDALGPGGASDDTASGTGRAVPDAFRYRLSVQRGGRRWDAVLDERRVPPELRPLLTKLVAHARRGPAGGPR